MFVYMDHVSELKLMYVSIEIENDAGQLGRRHMRSTLIQVEQLRATDNEYRLIAPTTICIWGFLQAI